MAEQELNGAHVGASLEQVHGEGVPQGMGRDRLGEAAPAPGVEARVLDGVRGKVVAGARAREEPRPGRGEEPPCPQELRSRGESMT